MLAEPARDNVRRRSPSPLANVTDGFNKLRVSAPKIARTVSDSTQHAFGSVQKQAPKAFQGVSKGAQKAFVDVQTGTQKAFVDVQTGTQKAFQTPAWESTVKGTQKVFRDVQAGIKRTVNGISVPKAFAQTSEDFSDLTKLAAGKPGICSRCATMPVDACFRAPDEIQEDYLSWASPLSRIALHASWCRVCHIILAMLCREENDPLSNPEVNAHIKPDWLRGMPLRQWVNEGYLNQDAYWPFGEIVLTKTLRRHA